MRNNKNEFNLWGDWNVCTFELLWLFFGKEAVFSKTYPSFLTVKEGSTSHLGLLPSGKKRETALRCSEPLRYKVGGPSKVFAHIVRDGTALMLGFLYLTLSLIYMDQQKEKTSYKYDFIFSLTLLQIQRNLQRF